jgi:hypothetical protein
MHQRLEQGRLDGSVTAHVLGIGLDALTLAATILTVVVIDDDAFEPRCSRRAVLAVYVWSVEDIDANVWWAGVDVGRGSSHPSDMTGPSGGTPRLRRLLKV